MAAQAGLSRCPYQHERVNRGPIDTLQSKKISKTQMRVALADTYLVSDAVDDLRFFRKSGDSISHLLLRKYLRCEGTELVPDNKLLRPALGSPDHTLRYQKCRRNEKDLQEY